MKHEAEDLKPVEQSVSYCPCNDYLEEELSIECESCKKYWKTGNVQIAIGVFTLTKRDLS